MNKYSIGVKLLSGFILVALITAFIGIFGTIKIKQIERLDTQLFKSGTKPMGNMAIFSTAYQQTRVHLRDIILSAYTTELNAEKYVQRLAELDQEMDHEAKDYQKTLVSEEGKKNFASLMEAIKKYAPLRAQIVELGKTGQAREAYDLMNGEGDVVAKQIDETLKKITRDTIDFSGKIADGNTATANATVTLSIIVTILGAIVAVLLGFFLARSITVPVNRVIEGLSNSSDQVASASSQVSAASQSLADGSSEQASAIEETSASIEELSSMTMQNAENASQANNLMTETSRVVGEANGSMQELTVSMKEITVGSEDMAKIIKTIDEIAFQTNLLALNAAVEAARAGEAGAGFAVVADEVRNLALRSAEAAKNTANLIDDSIKRIKNGSEIVTKTNEAFDRVLSGAKKVGDLVGEIAAASQEQAQGILQIGKAISEMDNVVQRNAATAEESASASEELNAQAMQMKDIVGEMTTVVKGGGAAHTRLLEARHGRKPASYSVHAEAPKQLIDQNKHHKITAAKPKIVKPSEVIPMDDHDEFKDF